MFNTLSQYIYYVLLVSQMHIKASQCVTCTLHACDMHVPIICIIFMCMSTCMHGLIICICIHAWPCNMHVACM